MIDTLTHFKDGKYLPVEEALKQLKAYKPAIIENHPTNQAQNLGFSIEELKDRYRLNNIEYHDGIYVVDWSKSLLDNGQKHVQEEWVQTTDRTEWKLPNSRLVHACLTALYKSRNEPDQTGLVQKMIENIFMPDFKENYLLTSTRVAYKPTGEDVVTHDIDQLTEIQIKTKMAGSARRIDADSGSQEAIYAILGTRNLTEVNQVYEWASGSRPSLQTVLEAEDYSLGAVVLGLSHAGQVFSICCDSRNMHPARGVIARKIEGGAR
jgi:hypothetical protein